jgi:hypothetical protein
MTPKRIARTCGAVLAIFMPAAMAQAQQPRGAQSAAPVTRQMPVPAARTLDSEPRFQRQADTHTLSSIETIGLGSLGIVTSMIDPSFTFGQSGDTGIVSGTTNSSTSFGINLAFDQSRKRSRLTGFYSGAQVFYYPYSVLNSRYHNLRVSQEFHLGRWLFRLNDDLTVSPEASFSGLDTGGTTTQSNLKPSAGINDTILTQRARRMGNTASTEVNYYFSLRSIVTVAGTFSTLRFSDPGFIDSQRITGRIGYDYALTPKDSMALIYEHGRADFSTVPTNQQTDTVHLSYGRKVTGRLAFQIAAGPQNLRSGSQGRILDWSATSSINYQTRRTQYFLSYSHTLSPGSGVFLGSSANLVTASVSRSLTQAWSASLGAGYAFDENLVPVSGTIDHFSNWYSNASLARPVGRHFRFDLSYRFQHQGTGAGICPVAACGSTQSRQTLGASLQWHPLSMNSR